MASPRGVHRDLGIEADHLHAELDRGVGDQAADGAQAHDAERPLRQLDPGELFLALLDELVELRSVRLQARHVGKRRDHVARGEQQRREHELLHRVGIGARRIEHRHAALRHLRHRDVVCARSGPADRLDALRNAKRVHVVRADQDRVGMLDGFPNRVACGRKTVQPVARDLVQGEDVVLGHGRHSPGLCVQPCRCSKSCMYSTSVRTPSIGMAL